MTGVFTFVDAPKVAQQGRKGCRKRDAREAAKRLSSWDLTADLAQIRFHRDTGRHARFVFSRAGGFVAC